MNKPKMIFQCACGVDTEIPPRYEPGSEMIWRIEEGYESEGGTHFPTQVGVVCPNCHAETAFI